MKHLPKITKTFKNHLTNSRLNREDADFVDSIHTDATFYGSFEAVGHLDFYLGRGGRYGLAQPQFDLVEDLLGASHNEAMDLYTATVNTRSISVYRLLPLLPSHPWPSMEK